MKRRDVDLLVARCASLGGTWGRQERIVQLMVDDKGWRRERAERAVSVALDEHILKVGRGGTLKFAGTDFAIYDDVRHRVVQSWAPQRGLRHACAHVTASARSARGEGNWIYPDVVMLADPTRRSSRFDERLLHTMEVEREKGFSVESVYQAYEQGRGADYSWVFFVSPGGRSGDEIRALLADTSGALSRSDLRCRSLLGRANRAAAELGVGLVAMIRPHNVSSWTTLRKAKRRSVVAGDRVALWSAVNLPIEHAGERPSRDGKCTDG